MQKYFEIKKLWSSTEGPDQPYKVKVSLDKVQTCSKNYTCSVHSWEKSRVCLCGILLLRVTGGAQITWTVLCWDWTNTATHIYTHVHSNSYKLTSSSSDLRPWLRMQAALIFVGMPQQHIGMNCFCDNCGSRLHLNSHRGLKFQFLSYKFTPEWRRCKTFCADLFFALVWDVSRGTGQQRIQPKEKLCVEQLLLLFIICKKGRSRETWP